MIVGSLEKLLYAVKVSVVSDGEPAHSQLLGPAEKALGGGKSVKDGILGMYVKMYEGHIWSIVLVEENKDKKKTGKIPAFSLNMVNNF